MMDADTDENASSVAAALDASAASWVQDPALDEEQEPLQLAMSAAEEKQVEELHDDELDDFAFDDDDVRLSSGDDDEGKDGQDELEDEFGDVLDDEFADDFDDAKDEPANGRDLKHSGAHGPEKH